ncbi:MAG: hypothetical protein Q4E12_01090 [Coriobacteriia bacterium]|nr:hypothetical protein [Coriobacteriia bacterium]
MGFPDFNNDGHTSAGEALGALGLIEDADRNGNWEGEPGGGPGGPGGGCSPGCLLCALVVLVLVVVIAVVFSH